MCGDCILRSKLSSAVSSLSLVHIPVEDFSPPEWLLQLPKLKRLSIFCDYVLVKDLMNWNRVISRLPSTLESLTIESTDSILAFSVLVDTSDTFQRSSSAP